MMIERIRGRPYTMWVDSKSLIVDPLPPPRGHFDSKKILLHIELRQLTAHLSVISPSHNPLNSGPYKNFCIASSLQLCIQTL